MKRSALLEKLKQSHFDLLIIGGGATGAGIALDAATRGLKAALIEQDDFASGTSSRSTKLIHGGVRYLEQAVKKLDWSQFALVRDALRERSILIQNAPHLSHPLPLLTPIYSWFGVPYFRIGLKIYDWLAGRRNLHPSRYLNRKKALKDFPMLREKGLKGGVLYYDGQFDDARMNVSIILAAIGHGAVALNHLKALSLLKKDGRLCGARVQDQNTGEEFQIISKVIINATGPGADRIRQMDDSGATPLLRTSSGTHIVLNERFAPPATGLLIPKTEDGRVLFLLPWLGHTLVGTTDNPAALQDNPKASEEDIQYILRHLKKYFDIPIQRSDVLSTWSGLRPLVVGPKAADTAKLSRDHVINVSDSGLLTITGGKWTTYRKMAEDAVNHAIQVGALASNNPSLTKTTLLFGTEGYSKQLAQELSRDFSLDSEVASHLARAYGGNAVQVAELARQGYGRRLASRHPYLEAEVIYAMENELALSPVDILGRRTRLTFLDSQAAGQALPRVLELLTSFFGWDESRRKQEEKAFWDYLGEPDKFEKGDQKTA
jgi:glycerol-3-phosphate dehydrogenase